MKTEIFILILLIIMAALWFMVGYTAPFKTKKPIEPTIKITIKNNIPDTTYIYER